MTAPRSVVEVPRSGDRQKVVKALQALEVEGAPLGVLPLTDEGLERLEAATQSLTAKWRACCQPKPELHLNEQSPFLSEVRSFSWRA